MRRFILAALALFGAATAANATCADTLYLQSITVYRQTLRNSATLGTWDSSLAINPWDSNQLVQAGPVGYSISFGGKDTVTHYLRFQYNCGADSNTTVLSARMVDTLALVREDYVHKVRADTVRQMQKVVMKDSTITQVGGALISLSKVWNADSFEVGTRDGVRQAWQGLYHSLIYKGKGITAGYLTPQITPFRESPMGSYSDLLGSIQSSLSGGADSVVAELRMFKYVYNYASPAAAVLPHASIAEKFVVRALSSGVELVLPRSTQVLIIDLNGRVVRNFAGGLGRQTWDGRDAFGRKLYGVWIVRAEGLGAVPVILR